MHSNTAGSEKLCQGSCSSSPLCSSSSPNLTELSPFGLASHQEDGQKSRFFTHNPRLVSSSSLFTIQSRLAYPSITAELVLVQYNQLPCSPVWYISHELAATLGGDVLRSNTQETEKKSRGCAAGRKQTPKKYLHAVCFILQQAIKSQTRVLFTVSLPSKTPPTQKLQATHKRLLGICRGENTVYFWHYPSVVAWEL